MHLLTDNELLVECLTNERAIQAGSTRAWGLQDEFSGTNYIAIDATDTSARY